MGRKRKKPNPPHDPDDRELTDQDITEMVVGGSAIAGQPIETKPLHHAISPARFSRIQQFKVPLNEVTDEELVAFLCFRMAQAKPYPPPREK